MLEAGERSREWEGEEGSAGGDARDGVAAREGEYGGVAVSGSGRARAEARSNAPLV